MTRFRLSKKTFLTALFYSSLTPLGVWTGYELGLNNWTMAGVLILISALLEFFAVTLWIDAQTDSLKR